MELFRLLAETTILKVFVLGMFLSHWGMNSGVLLENLSDTDHTNNIANVVSLLDAVSRNGKRCN